MAWLIIILLCLGNSRAQLLDVTNTSYLDFEDRLFGLLVRLQLEKFYDTLLVYGEDCAIPSLFERLKVPAVLVSSGSTNFDWNFSSLTLILSCSFQAEREENYRTLMKLQINRRLILLRGDIKPESVCDFYSRKEQHNIAMVKENFYQFGVVYSCRLFQHQNYEKLNLIDGKSIYIDQFRNMHGNVIRTLTDKKTPRTIPYRDDETGEEKYKGYVAMLINHFVEKVNATMEMQEDLIQERNLSFVDITDLISKDLLDIGICEARTLKMSNYDSISYPYLMSSYCFMVPMPDEMAFGDVYLAIMAPTVLIMLFIIFCICSVLIIYMKERSWRSLSFSSVLMNDICLRGFLAQPFPFPRKSNRKLKLIFMLVCFSSLISTTMYVAYLQSFMWGLPIEPFLTSFDDWKKSRYKMAINIYEREFLESLNVSLEGVEIFQHDDFARLRKSFNTEYLFPVTALQWFTFSEQQKFFSTNMFKYTEDFCLNHFDILSIPIRRHLPYRDIFEEHMLRQKEFGFTKNWIDESFNDMVKANLTSVEDLSPPPKDDTIEVHNLYWAFTMYFVGMGMGLCCFIFELLGPKKYWRN
ncbi:uncharacterized protein LOC120446166 [Drosophila santomea]|uniref:uncharacterized protein LOC120446166 n=1 Tax=Drosophila santomea TaxID=129105 RepID=UPI001952F582|nr:uncharacterized protein LOC120446166 [Drosophila santomea]